MNYKLILEADVKGGPELFDVYDLEIVIMDFLKAGDVQIRKINCISEATNED